MTDSMDGKVFREFSYETESDTLTIWDGGPAGGGGLDIVLGVLIVFFDYNHATPVGLTLTDAVDILGHCLPIKCIDNEEQTANLEKLDLKVEYIAANDSLWLGSSKPAQIAHPLLDRTVEVYFQAGSESILSPDGKIPSGVMIYDAAKRIESAILADMAEPAATAAME